MARVARLGDSELKMTVTEFTRENRYLVLKRKDIFAYLSEDESL